MGARVCRQVVGTREGVAARGAGVGSVAGMSAHVCRQVAGPREVLATGDAGYLCSLTNGFFFPSWY